MLRCAVGSNAQPHHWQSAASQCSHHSPVSDDAWLKSSCAHPSGYVHHCTFPRTLAPSHLVPCAMHAANRSLVRSSNGASNLALFRRQKCRAACNSAKFTPPSAGSASSSAILVHLRSSSLISEKNPPSLVGDDWWPLPLARTSNLLAVVWSLLCLQRGFSPSLQSVKAPCFICTWAFHSSSR